MKILDCFTVWCKPCQVIKPILKELEEKYPSIQFEYIDVEKEGNFPLLTKYGVRNVPTILFLNDNDEFITRLVGAQKKERIEEIIKENLNE